ncbi:hypothetical protein F5Y18DRAFT_370316 [Xylariaceae sp. FL1019]|nr:hypothetical protein F5Y18DRAFT_370316 [Xylariaceae sp. FL1019]
MPWARDSLPPAIYTFIVLNSVAVGLRVYVRTCISKSFGYDDIAMVVAFAGYVSLAGLTLTSLEAGYGAEKDQTTSASDVITGVKFFVASTIAYVIVLFIAKVSVALVLYRIAVTNKPIRLLIMISIGILTVWTTVSTIIVALQCTPLSLAWGVGEGTCLPAYILANTGYSISAMDIASSFLYASIPIFLLRGVQLSTRVKISVIVLLGLGVISSIVTIIRLKYLVDVSNLTNPVGVEAENAYLTTFVYSVVELGLTMFTASLAALRPLLKFVPFGQTTGKQYNSHSHGGYNQSGTKGSEVRSEMGNNMKLQEFNDADSTDLIIPSGRVHKTVQYDVKFSDV